MSLEDALAAQTQRPGPSCSVGALLERLPPDDAAYLREKLADPNTPTAKLSRALADENFMGQYAVKIQAQTLRRHHNGNCSCGTR
jgi:hypothetical protein